MGPPDTELVIAQTPRDRRVRPLGGPAIAGSPGRRGRAKGWAKSYDRLAQVPCWVILVPWWITAAASVSEPDP